MLWHKYLKIFLNVHLYDAKMKMAILQQFSFFFSFFLQLIILVWECDIKSLYHWPSLGLVCNILVSSQVFCPSPFHRSQTSHRTLRTGAASVHSGECRGRQHKVKTASLHLLDCLYSLLSFAFVHRLLLFGSGKTCGPGVWCEWCSSPPGGQSCSPLCMQNQKGIQIQDRHASSRLYLWERESDKDRGEETVIKKKVCVRVHLK